MQHTSTDSNLVLWESYKITLCFNGLALPPVTDWAGVCTEEFNRCVHCTGRIILAYAMFSLVAVLCGC